MTETKNERTPQIRFLAGLVLVALTIGFGFWFLRPMTETKAKTGWTPVFGGWVYRSGDQTAAATALAKASLADYRWEDGRLLVPEEKRTVYEKVLGESQALPKAPSDIKRESISAMSQFEPESKTRLRDLEAAARQLEATIEEFDQIKKATVGVNTHQESSGLGRKTVTTASIGVLTKGALPLSAEMVTAITLAAKHHFGIANNDDISIMDFSQGRSFRGNDRAVAAYPTFDWTREQVRQENLWREKFLTAFDYIPGVRVTAVVDLAPTGSDLPSKVATNEEKSAAPSKEEAEADISLGDRSVSTGLLFRSDGPDGWDSNATDDYSEEISGGLKPRAIAVSIAIPKSSLRKIAGITEEEAETSAVNREEAIQKKTDEVIRYVRQTAMTLLAPIYGPSSDRTPEGSIQVVVWPDEAEKRNDTSLEEGQRYCSRRMVGEDSGRRGETGYVPAPTDGGIAASFHELDPASPPSVPTTEARPEPTPTADAVEKSLKERFYDFAGRYPVEIRIGTAAAAGILFALFLVVSVRASRKRRERLSEEVDSAERELVRQEGQSEVLVENRGRSGTSPSTKWGPKKETESIPPSVSRTDSRSDIPAELERGLASLAEEDSWDDDLDSLLREKAESVDSLKKKVSG